MARVPASSGIAVSPYCRGDFWMMQQMIFYVAIGVFMCYEKGFFAISPCCSGDFFMLQKMIFYAAIGDFLCCSRSYFLMLGLLQ